MKSPLRKLRGFGHHKGDSKEKRERRPPAKLDELVQAAQDMIDMRNCYDSLLSAAAATANSVFEFSEALEEMGTCLLEKTALNDDEDSGRVLLMLGKAQFELQKLVDGYRAHVVQTITTPSESLLKELQTVEEMKRQCDYKRDSYKYMLAAHQEKGRSRYAKGETFSSRQLQEAQVDYEEEANMFVFRLKSLKQGQSRSLLTQAARHHAAQLSFFRKGLKSLEVVEPHIKVLADREHIDYQFSGLEDDDTEDDYDDYGYDGNYDGELSFDYGQNDQREDVLSTSRNSMELDQADCTVVHASTTEHAQQNAEKSQTDFSAFNMRTSAGSQSAPIYAHKKFDPSDRLREIRPSLSRKFHTYVLPTPVEGKSGASTGSHNAVSAVRQEREGGLPSQLWHSSPLEPHKFVNNFRDDELPSTTLPKAQSAILKESNFNRSPITMPPPLSEGGSLPQFSPYTGSDSKKIKRHAFSGPLTSKPWSNKSVFSATGYVPSVEHPPVSTMPARVRTPQPSISQTSNASPPPAPSPKISELHELPRPPVSSAKHTRPTSLIGHSAPLFYRGQEPHKTSKMPTISSHTASPLPTPPAAVHRSHSIPSRSQRTPMTPVASFLEAQNSDLSEEVASPPLTPISLMHIRPASPASESVIQVTKEKGLV